MKNTIRMPALFIGHGSPMNALESNRFTQKWGELAAEIPRPIAILCISAHWYINSPTAITAAAKLNTIHDFYGFPQALFDVDYSPLGDVQLCERIVGLIEKPKIQLNTEYGIDHGAWSILKQMYPRADVPVLQLSIDSSKSPEWHYALGQQLSILRNEGILIIASGNIIHNLHLIDWYHPNHGFKWAVRASDKIKQLILQRKDTELFSYDSLGDEVKLAIPSPEHFLPLLYLLGLRDENDGLEFFNDELIMGSLSMTSIKIG